MEKVNLVEKLKGCPKGTPLYSPIFGNCTLFQIDYDEPWFPIFVVTEHNENRGFTKYGTFFSEASYDDMECILFPSKECRDWSAWKKPVPRFDVKTLKPFDKVLARRDGGDWTALLYSHSVLCDNPFYKDGELNHCCGDSCFRFVVPYNEETEHLLGTRDAAPEFYRWWEE